MDGFSKRKFRFQGGNVRVIFVITLLEECVDKMSDSRLNLQQDVGASDDLMFNGLDSYTP